MQHQHKMELLAKMEKNSATKGGAAHMSAAAMQAQDIKVKEVNAKLLKLSANSGGEKGGSTQSKADLKRL